MGLITAMGQTVRAVQSCNIFLSKLIQSVPLTTEHGRYMYYHQNWDQTVYPFEIALFRPEYSRTSVAQTPLEPWKDVRDG